MSDEISKSLGLTPLSEIEDIDDVVDGNEIEEAEVIDESKSQVEDDFDFARENLYNIIKTSNEAMEEMLSLAKASEHPRAFEVLNGMLKNMADFNKDLIDLQKKKKDIIQVPQEQGGPQTVNNNLFVGTTADFTKMLEDARNKK